AHHQHFFTDRDPDYRRKQGPEWTFPQPGRRLLRTMVLDALGLNAWRLLRSKDSREPAPGPQPAAPWWLRPAYFLALLAVLVVTGTWPLFLLYWLLPLLTVLQVIVRWAAVAEHRYNLVHPTVVEATPLIMLRWWEALLLPDLNFHTF